MVAVEAGGSVLLTSLCRCLEILLIDLQLRKPLKERHLRGLEFGPPPLDSRARLSAELDHRPEAAPPSTFPTRNFMSMSSGSLSLISFLS